MGQEYQLSWIKLLPGFIRIRLEGRTALHKIIANIGWLLCDHVLRMGLGLFVGIWLARYLGPEQFGIFNYALAFVTLFGEVAAVWVDAIAVRDIVRDPSSREEILGTAFSIKFLSGVLAFLITLEAVYLLRSHDPTTCMFVAIVAIGMLFRPFDTIDLFFQSQVQSKFPVLAKNAAFVIVALAKIELILLKAPLIAFAWTGLAEIVLGAISLIIVYRLKGLRLLAWGPNWRRAMSLISDAWPLLLSTMAIMLYTRLNILILGQLAGNTEVGIFSVAYKFVEVWFLLPMVILRSFMPSIVEAKEMGETIFYLKLQKLYNLMALVGYVAAIITTIFSTQLIHVLLGEAYRRAAPMLAILTWAGIFTNLGIGRGAFLTTMNWTRVSLLTTLLGCVTSITLNFILIPRFGAMGAVIASWFAILVTAYGSCFLYKPLHRTGIMLTKALIYPKIW
jgi:O-antigen/teichoic acid export membrane protein